MLRFEEALARVVALGAPPLPSETIALEDADGRVVAEDVVAPFDLPPFDYSAMDGYAVRASEVTEAGARLPVRGESKTGVVPSALEAGAAMRIFTGAELPAGADAIVMQEEVTREDDVAVFARAAARGQHVRRRGEDLARGAVAIAKGTRLRPAHLGLAAACDRTHLVVARRPVVAVLATGDELRAPGSDASAGTIPESNTWALRAMARRAGAVARVMPYVPDDRAATEAAFARALDADVVVTIGGVSVGDHDLVRPALEAVGVTIDLWKVAIKPGKPLAVGRKAGTDGAREKLVLGVPGNPSSAMVTFAVFGVPLLRALQGDARPFPSPVRARVTRALRHAPGRRELARAYLGEEDGKLVVTPLANQASGAPTSMAAADALLSVPAEQGDVAAGDEVEVLLLSELGG